MSRRRAYTDATLAVMQRFFAALDALTIEEGLTSYKFCTQHNIDRRHFSQQKKDNSRGYFEVSWIISLCSYGISAEWILFGKGTMKQQEDDSHHPLAELHNQIN